MMDPIKPPFLFIYFTIYIEKFRFGRGGKRKSRGEPKTGRHEEKLEEKTARTHKLKSGFYSEI